MIMRNYGPFSYKDENALENPNHAECTGAQLHATQSRTCCSRLPVRHIFLGREGVLLHLVVHILLIGSLLWGMCCRVCRRQVGDRCRCSSNCCTVTIGCWSALGKEWRKDTVRNFSPLPARTTEPCCHMYAKHEVSYRSSSEATKWIGTAVKT